VGEPSYGGLILDRMTKDQFPIQRRVRAWSLVIGIWSFPQDSHVVFTNRAGLWIMGQKGGSLARPIPAGRTPS
jgi:hypothetical protein